LPVQRTGSVSYRYEQLDRFEWNKHRARARVALAGRGAADRVPLGARDGPKWVRAVNYTRFRDRSEVSRGTERDKFDHEVARYVGVVF
jgi:hypothetical protein